MAKLGKMVLGKAVLGTDEDSGPEMPDFTKDRFRWGDHCWEMVSDPDLGTALVLPGGNETAQEEFAARLANILRLNVENLYVTDTAVINEAVINRLFVDMFTTNKIGADEIAANSIDVSKLRVTGEMAAEIGNFLTINAEQVNGGSFSGETFVGGEFEGAVIIGGAIATTRYPSSDGGIHLATSTGLRGWDSRGKLTFQLSASTGRVQVRERLYATDSTNRGVILFPTTTAGVGGLWFTDDGTGGSAQAAVYRDGYSNGDEPLVLRGARSSGVDVKNILTVQGPIIGKQDVTASRNFIAQGYVATRKPGSTSGSANAQFQSGNGRIRMVTSSRRYKKNIAEWNPDRDAVIKLQPRQWQHSDPEEPDNIDERWYVGFISEEVDELGLYGLVRYEGDGKGGWVPDALNYDRFAAAQQVVLRDHDARIIELEERLAALETGD